MVYFRRRATASGRIDKNRGKIETMRPFEPSSTAVHPCTAVEGEFRACTKHRCCMEPLPSIAVPVEMPHLFCGVVKKRSDAVALNTRYCKERFFRIY